MTMYYQLRRFQGGSVGFEYAEKSQGNIVSMRKLPRKCLEVQINLQESRVQVQSVLIGVEVKDVAKSENYRDFALY